MSKYRLQLQHRYTDDENEHTLTQDIEMKKNTEDNFENNDHDKMDEEASDGNEHTHNKDVGLNKSMEDNFENNDHGNMDEDTGSVVTQMHLPLGFGFRMCAATRCSSPEQSPLRQRRIAQRTQPALEDGMPGCQNHQHCLEITSKQCISRTGI